MNTFFRVWKYARRYPAYAYGMIFCAVLTTLAGMVFPKVTGMLVDAATHPKATFNLGAYALIVGVAFFLRDAFNGLRIWLNNAFEQNVIVDLRQELYEAMQRLPLGWYDNRATGDLMTRVTEDVMSVERMLIDGIEQGVVAVLQVGGVGAILFWQSPLLAAWMLLPIAFMAVGAYLYTTTAHVRYKAARTAASAMNSLLHDNLQGIRQIKSYAREEQEAKRFAERSDTLRTTSLEVMRAWALYSPSMSFLSACGFVIVLLAGGQMVATQHLSPGDLVAFLLYTSMFYEPLNRLHSLNQMIQAGRAASGRVFEIMDTVQEKYERNAAAIPLSNVVGELDYKAVRFEYRPGLPVLHDIDLHVPAGTSLALVGPSGAGKSTIVGLLPRFYELTSGKITIDGRDIRELGLSEIRRVVGVVTQESFLFNGTILENLRFGRPDATLAEVESAARASHAHEFIAQWPEGYHTTVGERGVKLSVGEKQRVSIARALLKNPPILVLDEATASVDTATERLIQDALDRLLAGRTSLIIAHRLSTVRNADQIAVVKSGTIVELGNHDSLLALGGLYTKLSRIQQGEFFREEQFQTVFQ